MLPMPIPDPNLRIAIVGAGSPRGRELRDVLESGGFSGAGIELLDEDIAVGTLTRQGDEVSLISAVDPSSFDGARLVFFAGRADMAARHGAQAVRAGARVIDLSEDPGLETAKAWIPSLDGLTGRPDHIDGAMLRSPSAAAITAASIAAALDRFHPSRLAMVFLRPVSERGQEGIDELERQTVSLLSFRPVSEEVFGAQVAFNMVDAYGAEGGPSLEAVRRRIALDARTALGGRVAMPAIQVLQAPVFFSYAFTAYIDLAEPAESGEIEAALARAGLRVEAGDQPRPTNIGVTGRPEVVIGPVGRDPAARAGYWLWGAADNVRVVASNAVAIAEAVL